MKSLQEFYNDKETRDNVKAFQIEFLGKIAIKKAFEREDTSSIAEAKELIEKSFEEMEIMFSPKPKIKKIINQSR